MTSEIVLVARNRFANWRKRRVGREYLAVLFVDCNGKCPNCGQDMVLSYEDKPYKNRATFNHKTPLSESLEPHAIEDLEIMCWDCNRLDSHEVNIRRQQASQDQE